MDCVKFTKNDFSIMKSMKRKNCKSVPPTAFSFYIKLYCSRKNSTDTAKYSRHIAAATKAWLALSESEKQQIDSKFQECKEKYRLEVLNELKNAEPFMKIKNIRVRKADNLPANRHEIEETKGVSTADTENNVITESCEQLPSDSEQRIPTPNDSPISHDHEDNENIIEETTINSQPQPTLIEPIPPSVKNGHELFCMLTSADQPNNITWSSLPHLEKNQYSRAVSLMKKDYIHKYKEYLENLSPKVLFDHYNKMI